MVQKYDDDEQINDVQSIQSPPGSLQSDNVTATYFNKVDAPLNKTMFKVLLELKGSEAKERPGVDIVLVLGVGGSSKGKNLKQMQTACKFLVKKLSCIDRLSVIQYSTHAHRLCPLRQMNPNAQSEIEGLINSLKHGGLANITRGLEEAVQVLNDRRLTKGREVAIMLVSDGPPSPIDADGSQVCIDDVPVHTFGLGEDCDPEVLVSIAERSGGGTFSTTSVTNTETSNLSLAFSQCLAGLLSVVVQDLNLTIKKKQSTINDVSAGNYIQSRDYAKGSITISFGNLYSGETRRVLVDLALAEVTESQDIDVLEFEYSFKSAANQNMYEADPVTIRISRTENATTQESPEVLIEEARHETVGMMKEARQSADVRGVELLEVVKVAKYKLDEAKTKLELQGLTKSHPMVKSLTSELEQFLKLLESRETYVKLGRAFSLASELAHSLQRFASKGDVNELRMFATRNMDQVLIQVKDYENDPNYIVPPSSQDPKQRVEDVAAVSQPAPPIQPAQHVPPAEPTQPAQPAIDPAVVKKIAKDLKMHLGQAIESLKAMQLLLDDIDDLGSI